MRGLHLTRQSRFNKPESKLNQSESNLIKVKIPISAIPDLSTHDSPKPENCGGISSDTIKEMKNTLSPMFPPRQKAVKRA